MIVRLSRFLIIGFTFMAIFNNRFRIMNWLLGNPTIRKWAVSSTMSIPMIRNFFLRTAFGSSSPESSFENQIHQ
jgi:hypothetical protein